MAGFNFAEFCNGIHLRRHQRWSIFFWRWSLFAAGRGCLSHNPLHPWLRGEKGHRGGWQEPKSPGGGGGGGGNSAAGGAGASAGFTFPPTPPTDGGPEPSQEYNLAAHAAMGVFLHPDPSGGPPPSSCDVKPMLAQQQKPREGRCLCALDQLFKKLLQGLTLKTASI
jgi:hypothetical protein